MKKYKFKFFVDKDNINEIRVSADIKENGYKGILVDADSSTPLVAVQEMPYCYKIIWLDDYSDIMGGYDIGRRVYGFWQGYITGMEAGKELKGYEKGYGKIGKVF